jgi:hypothetical protein
LIFLIIVSAVCAPLYLLSPDFVKAGVSDAPPWGLPLMGVLSALNLVFAVALLQWKKWGFYGCCAVAVLAFIVNLSAGLGVGPSLLGLVGIAALYGVLHIGGDRKAWPQLE